jgi:hypothetical protein
MSKPSRIQALTAHSGCVPFGTHPTTPAFLASIKGYALASPDVGVDWAAEGDISIVNNPSQAPFFFHFDVAYPLKSNTPNFSRFGSRYTARYPRYLDALGRRTS